MIPLGKRLLCREVVTTESYAGGRIILAEDTRNELTKEQAEVVTVGPSCEQGLKPGDWIIHKPHARCAGPTDDTFLIWEDDVVAVLSV